MPIRKVVTYPHSDPQLQQWLYRSEKRRKESPGGAHFPNHTTVIDRRLWRVADDGVIVPAGRIVVPLKPERVRGQLDWNQLGPGRAAFPVAAEYCWQHFISVGLDCLP